LSPPYIATELGLGPASISKAIQTVSGLTPAALRRLYNKTGDAGDVAFEAKSNVRTLMPHKSLTITGVYDSLVKICNTKGEGAGKRKQAIVERLLVAAKGEETRYLVRTLSQHIRVGAVRTSILTALSRAMVLTRPKGFAMSLDDSPYYASPDQLSCVVAHSIQSPSKGKRKAAVEGSVRSIITEKFAEAERLLRKVYVQHPNYDSIVDALLQHGMEGLSAHVSLTVGE
jgi:DNA ligase-1